MGQGLQVVCLHLDHIFLLCPCSPRRLLDSSGFKWNRVANLQCHQTIYCQHGILRKSKETERVYKWSTGSHLYSSRFTKLEVCTICLSYLNGLDIINTIHWLEPFWNDYGLGNPHKFTVDDQIWFLWSSPDGHNDLLAGPCSVSVRDSCRRHWPVLARVRLWPVSVLLGIWPLAV